MNVNEERMKERGHVYYFEPNDLDFGVDQDGNQVNLTPHLEDLCISMSLTAEIRNRDHSNNNVTTSTISWVSYPQVDQRPHSADQIVNGGVDFRGQNYLTTYYTEISADQYIDHELVEGLGVTNVNISFESWYTPTITINFIDIHGSALWGREEAIHDNGKITSDNLLGVFFTQPYPLFRLQVKGFLGHDVTYQLSVSSFKGRYNSQTGNFEATVQFIGYSYSLLTDIPLKCLSYVSELSYVGKKYWDDNVLNNPKWQLINADNSKTTPIKLYQLIERIKNAIGTIDSQRARSCDNTEINVTTAKQPKDISEDGQNVALASAANVTEALKDVTKANNLSVIYNDFLQKLDKTITKDNGGKLIIGSENNNNGSVSHQALMIVKLDNEKKFRINADACWAYQVFRTSLSKYNEANKDKQIINGIAALDVDFDNWMPRSKGTTHGRGGSEILRFEKRKLILPNGVTKYSDIKFIGKRKMFESTSNELKSIVEKDNKQLAEHLVITQPSSIPLTGSSVYAYLLPLGSTLYQLEKYKESAISASTNVENKVENNTAAEPNGTEKVSVSSNSSQTDDWMEETRKKKIIDLLGFEPTIGNFVKLMMCHLETFIEVMQFCGDKIEDHIKNGERTLDKLGIEIDDTDIPSNNKQPYPWPALYNPVHKEKNGETSNGNQIGDKYDVLGWPNDFNAKADIWEEKKVVLSIVEAIEKYGGDSEDPKRTGLFKYDGLPMTGSDLYTLTSPFRYIGRECTSIEKIAPYLGLRAANIIGIGDNKCSQSDAEILGYMDALNMISSYSKYDKLKQAFQSKDPNNSFISQIMGYLTCNPNVIPTNETEAGKKYNSFETIKSGGGNLYHSTRHPMFVGKKEGKEEYTYSYIYSNPINNTDNPISIVPIELQSFNGVNNPYNDLFDTQRQTDESGNSEYNFLLKINDTVKNKTYTGSPQNFIYNCDTDNLLPPTSYPNYTNDRLFYVNNNVGLSKTFVQQIDDFKSGKVKYKNYTVKDNDDLKKFFDRKYKVSLDEYCGRYKDWRMLTTSITEDDSKYAEEHLCFSSEKKESVKYDNSWFDTSSTLIKDKLSKSIKEKADLLKKDGNDDKLLIRELMIKVNETEYSLFGSKFYYQQNLAKDRGDEILNEERVFDKCKAYLILSSIMSAVKLDNTCIFKNDNTSMIQYIQPCYVLFLGALLWRKRYMDTFEEEPLYTVGFEIPNSETSFITKDENKFYIGTDNTKNCYTIEDYYMKYEDIDLSVRNKLINVFENFVFCGSLGLITKYCELQGAEDISDGERWENWCGKWTAFNDDEVKKPSQWETVFKNIYGNYSSIILTENKQGLRLLFDENNMAMGSLKELYGLNGGYIVSRATTERVGRGNNEVKINPAQMNGYLSGFLKRINEVHDESEEKEDITVTKDEEDVTRDICVSMYYSLKHLWDTWLITAEKKQYTVENFFNRNFVFIDSFYINMFNVIKLNAETILDAYNNKDSNLLTFITHVTSKEGCMFFALPSFLDSNVMNDNGTTVSSFRGQDNMSWKKENLQKVFTPIPYNQIGSPKIDNTFVFIYTHPFSNNASENTDYTFDSYDMYKYEKRPNVLKVDVLPPKDEVVGADDYNNYIQRILPNNSRPTDEDELISARYGYLMPCFGVTVNRGNNYIFKSINVNMDSPKITNVSAQTWEDILTKTGADGSKRVFFHGQDIYEIYSQYSYACEIEMMGCAQIQPLMYFQLLNIPMWRGTYMIYKVTHNMQAGMMTTKFTGMKMSRRQAPYANGYFVVGKQSAQTGKITVNGNGSGDGTASASGKYPVGGPDMIKRIFGNYTDYKDSENYDKYRGKTDKGTEHYHCGTDISGAEGTPLYAPWDGYVKYATYSSKSSGNYVMFFENSGVYSVVYMHCKELKVKVGDKVKAGEVLALLGKTGGNAVTGKGCGPHLHLELHTNGNYHFGESKRHGGTADHIDPSKNIGYVGTSETTTNDTQKLDNSLLKVNSGKSDGICVVGDSWANGLGNFFQYKVCKDGAQVKTICKEYMPIAAASNCQKILICCGLNSLGLSETALKDLFVKMGKLAKEKGKTCYVCKLPEFNYGSITKENIQKLNRAITSGHSQGGYGIHIISEQSIKNNLGGFHPKSYKPLVDEIKI